MAAQTAARRRVISGLAVSGGLALLALAAPAAHAASTPAISASVAGRTTIQVSGSGFGSGDRVEVVDSVGGSVFTTATRTIIIPPPPKCTSKNPCLYGPVVLGGRIDVTMPKHVVKCVLQLVTVRAHDLTNHTFSNTVRVTLGFGLCK